MTTKANLPAASASLEQLRARFDTIPITKTLKIKLLAASAGSAEMRIPYSSNFDGVFASLHGGIMMTLADTVACAAVMSLTGVDTPMTTTDMNIRFLKACRTDCTAVATVIKFGRTLVPTAVNLTDADGTLVAIAQVTYMQLR